MPRCRRGGSFPWRRTSMIEVKADALEASFEALEREDEDVAALRGEVAALRARIEGQAIARPALSGVKSEPSPFVERYLRKGLEAGVELKALSGATDAAGGYAVPEEIDQRIEKTLTAISPIRSIASVVRVGSAGYRKLVTTGGAGGFPNVAPQDKLIDLVQALRPPYRQGAVFVMNSSTAARIRKFKTDDGAFVWQPGLVAGQPDTLLGYPVVEAEDMPDVAADSLSVAFDNS